MRIPKHLKIKRSTWKVTLDDTKLDIDQYNGLCIPDKKEILIDPNLPQKDLEETLIHEILHAIFPSGIVGHRKEEEIVYKLAKSIHAGLIDNGLAITKSRKRR